MATHRHLTTRSSEQPWLVLSVFPCLGWAVAELGFVRRLPVIPMAEYYRQFAFVSSVLAGFAFTFYGTLLVASSTHRVASWAALLAMAASAACLIVTLGTTFSAVRAAGLPAGTPLPPELATRQAPISMCFLLGIFFCLRASELRAGFAHIAWGSRRRWLPWLDCCAPFGCSCPSCTPHDALPSA